MKTHRAPNPRRGFALIATLSIMVLLTLLTVGLLGLSTTALRSSSQSKDRAIAQANARLALMIALGEIQASLGPDQRVTARSEMLGSSPASPLLTGVFKTTRANLPTDPTGYFEQLRDESKSDTVWLASSTQPITDPATQSPAQLNDKTVRMQSAFDATGKEIFVQAGKIPLIDDNNEDTGSYAWWADDESQKAKLNVVAPESLTNGNPLKENWKLAPAQQANFFRVDEDPAANSYSPGEIADYDPEDRDGIKKLVSLHQADIPYSVAGSDDWFRQNQTDFTTLSKGLPVDVLEGRLKQDLSAYLETGEGLGDDEPILRGSPGDTGYTGPQLSGLNYSDKDMPRFGLIKSWKEIGETVGEFDTGGSESIARTETEHGIHPVILRAGIYYAPYLNPAIRQESVEVPGNGGNQNAFYVSWKLAAYPRITIWNPTSVPITDPWYLYQVGVTNHFMLVLSGDQSDVRSGGAARDDKNVEYWRAFRDGRRMSFYNMMNANRQSDTIPSGGRGEPTMPLHTYALRLDSPLLPGQTRTFYPESSTPPLLSTVTKRRFSTITNSNASSYNVMAASPAPNNYFRVVSGNEAEFENRIYAKDARQNLPSKTRPAPPEFLESYLYVRMAESGPGFKGTHTHGCSYRLFKPNRSGPPTLLQEIFSAEHTNSTNGFPTYSISNAREYDDPDDGVTANGFTLVKFYENPNQEISSRRGHQIYISYALEDPQSDFSSKYMDESKQFSAFTHYNPRSPHVFPGTFEENATGVGTINVFDSRLQGSRQEFYSEGRPEGSWLNDWTVDSIGSSESNYGPNNDFGSPGLYDLNLGSNGLVYPLFDFPRSDDGVLSLGELQAVNFASYPWQPGNAFGNSFADPRVPRDQFANEVDQSEDHPYIRSLDLGTNRYIDLSWLLNYSMWDRFFLSTIDYASSANGPMAGDVLRNSRNRLTLREGQQGSEPAVEPAGDPLNEAAANIQIDGPFNVNTTSVAAWKQFLSANFNRQVPVRNTSSGDDSTPADQAAFPRLLYPYRAEMPEGSRDIGSSDEATRSAFAGNRSLSDEEVQKLAEKIVDEVRLRGPFLSISDFVNRRLVSESDTKYGEWAGLSGVLQTAIDRVTVEDGMINNHLEADSDLLFASSDVPAYLQQSHVTGRPDGIQQSRLAGTPGSLSQADILRAVGPMLTARGDTFRIRAYGESRDPSGNTRAEAWCEAVVQRVATPVHPNDSLIEPDQATHRFGRKFRIESFRWLNENEI